MDEGNFEKNDSTPSQESAPESKPEVPKQETRAEGFDTKNYEQGVKEYQETHHELEIESQQRDLEYLEQAKGNFDPETLGRTRQFIINEKYMPNKEEKTPEKEAEEKIEEEDLFEPKIGEFSFEDKVEAERKLDNLGRLMEGADFDWWLDGGLNIPTHTGEYYRKHKDIEISVNKEDIKKLHVCAEQKGYHIFRNREKLLVEDIENFELGGSCLLSNVEEFTKETEHIDTEIELHIHQKDDEGSQIVDGVKIPKKYFENPPIYKTVSGHEVRLSHPLVVAFHKLKMERGKDPFEPLQSKLKDPRKSYDIEDLKKLRQKLSDKDMLALEILITEQTDKRIETADEKIEELFNSLDLKASISEIRKIIEEKLGAGREKGYIVKKYQKIAEEMAFFITENRNIDFDGFNLKLKEIVNFDEVMSRLGRKFKIMEKEKGLKQREKLPKEIDNLLTEEEKDRYENVEKEQEEKGKIVAGIKDIYKKVGEIKERIKNKEVNENDAIRPLEESLSVTIVGEHLAGYVKEFIDVALDSESEEDYLETLRRDKEKYVTEINRSVENKFSRKAVPKEEAEKAIAPEEKEEKE